MNKKSSSFTIVRKVFYYNLISKTINQASFLNYLFLLSTNNKSSFIKKRDYVKGINGIKSRVVRYIKDQSMRKENGYPEIASVYQSCHTKTDKNSTDKDPKAYNKALTSYHKFALQPINSYDDECYLQDNKLDHPQKEVLAKVEAAYARLLSKLYLN